MNLPPKSVPHYVSQGLPNPYACILFGLDYPFTGKTQGVHFVVQKRIYKLHQIMSIWVQFEYDSTFLCRSLDRNGMKGKLAAFAANRIGATGPTCIFKEVWGLTISAHTHCLLEKT